MSIHLSQAQQIVEIRNQLSPTTKLSCDEMGVILPDDNTADVRHFQREAPILPHVFERLGGADPQYLLERCRGDVRIPGWPDDGAGIRYSGRVAVGWLASDSAVGRS